MKAISVPLSNAPELLHSILQMYGVAVVTDVLTAEECVDFENKFTSDLLELVDADAIDQAPQIVRDAYQRFLREGLPAFPTASADSITEAAGFALERCLPHGRFAWAVRCHKNVHAAFSAAFGGEEEFVTSQDVPFFSPVGQAASERCQFS